LSPLRPCNRGPIPEPQEDRPSGSVFFFDFDFAFDFELDRFHFFLLNAFRELKSNLLLARSANYFQSSKN
jgi:hypothetical protein